MNIGEKIKAARERARLSQEALADRCGWNHQSRVSGYETGKREPSFEDLKKIAIAVGLSSTEELIGGTGLTNEPGANYSISMRKVPLISWIAAGTWCESGDPYSPGEAEEWLECPFPFSDKAFCLRVIGDSMSAEFGYRDGEVILVDPSVSPRHNDDVIARTPDGSYTFKRLQVTPEGSYLLALNPDHPNRKISIPEGTTICGVVTGSWLKRR